MLFPHRRGSALADATAYHTGGGSGIGCGVDQDEAAGGAVVGVRIKKNRAGRRYLYDSNVVHTQGVDRLLLKSLHVDAVKDAGGASAERLRAVLEQVRLVTYQWRFVEPDKRCFEILSGLWRAHRVGHNVAAADIELILQGDGAAFQAPIVNGPGTQPFSDLPLGESQPAASP